MPFDLSRSPHDLLHAAARTSGLRILDLDLLEQHKVAELRHHPPNWGYHHRGALRIAFGLALIVEFLVLVLVESKADDLALVPIAVMTATVITAWLAPIRGPARWRERHDQGLIGVHPRVAGPARRLQAELPDVEFQIGELFQDRVKLDPYLVAQCGGARLLLGIWEGERVIACA